MVRYAASRAQIVASLLPSHGSILGAVVISLLTGLSGMLVKTGFAVGAWTISSAFLREDRGKAVGGLVWAMANFPNQAAPVR